MSSAPEKQSFYQPPQNGGNNGYGQGAYGYPPAPTAGQGYQNHGQNPGYNSSYPPPQVYQQPQQESHGSNACSGFGSQFCGAVVFGAGATLGSRIMNSLFGC